MSRRFILLAAAAWGLSTPAFAQSSTVSGLTASSPIVGTQLTYCAIAGTSSQKCTFTQVDAFINAQFSGDCTAGSGGLLTCLSTNGTAFGPLATLTSPVPVNKGGTGTTTPALVGGTNISISGTWPNQTIGFSGTLPVNQGGTGTTTPGLVAGTNVTITGSWPNQTINSSGGGGSLSVTDGTTTVSGATSVTFNGASVSGTTPNASVTISGGTGQTNFTTHAALISATTAFSTDTLMQQGYSASGDGGAAFYDWNATSYCPGGTSGTPTAADRLVCILPSGQSASTGGRYLLRLANGAIDARQLGFKDDASDNSSLVAGMNNAMFLTGARVIFSASSVRKQANYWFLTQPLSVAHAGGIACGDGSEADREAPSVSLVFAAGISGVEWLNAGAAPLRGLGAYATNNLRGATSGCNIYSAGVGFNNSGTTTNGSATTSIPFVGISGAMAGGALISNPILAIGDGLAIFPHIVQYWFFTGSISGSTLTVATTPTPFQTANSDPGIMPGQQLQATGLPHGIYIKKQLTGTTGQSGTYQLSYSIASPPLANEAVSGGTIGSEAMQTEVQTGQPMVAPGTTITSCTTNTANQCPPSGTMVLSNPATRGQDWAFFLLPGPNSAQGNEEYTVTTSLTGHTFAQLTAGISGTTMTASAGPTLDLGQVVIGTTGNVSTTTTGGAALTIGQYNNIHVSSCSGITSGMYVVGFDSGTSVFPPGTTVNTCTAGSPNLLSVNVNTNPTTITASGSPVVQGLTYNTDESQMWIGEPITGTDIPANTTVVSWAHEPDDWTYFNVTMSNNATGTTSSGTWALGGAVDAAPSGTTLFFLSGSANITAAPGGGVYTLDQSVTLAGGSHLYAYDTPGTMYITSGPRSLMPETPLWTDAFPFGAVAYQIYGTSPSHETAIVTTTRPEIFQQLGALVAHSSGSGKMWAIPSGYYRNTRGTLSGSVIQYFGIGINFAGGQDMVPSSGGDGSYDMHNDVFFDLIGRLEVGNNTGGSVDIGSEYDENWISDITTFSGIGTAYFGIETQSEDESYNTHVFQTICGTNSSPNIGGYASGSQWNGTCVPNQNGSTFASQSTVGAQDGGPWAGNLWQIPYTPPVPQNVFQPTPTGVTCTGTPTSSFKSIGGIVTHC